MKEFTQPIPHWQKILMVVFISAVCISMIALVVYGAYLKYQVLEPLGLGEEYNIVELAFLYHSDEGLRYQIQFAQEGTEPSQEPTEPSEIYSTEDTSTEPEQTWDITEPTDPEPTVEETSGASDNQTEKPTEATVPTETQKPTSATEPSETQKPTAATESTQSATESTTQPTTETTAKSDTYVEQDFSQGAVSTDWYDDVLFIGDSRTVGLRDYARAGNADYFCSVGMTLFSVTTSSVSDTGFSSQTLSSLLSTKTYGKIIISLGINECGYSHSTIISKYQSLLDLIAEKQPDAIVILQAVMAVSEKYVKYGDCFKPSNLQKINTKIEALADGESIYYIDVNEVFTDNDGYLYSELSSDGCHLKAKYTKVWAEWISYAVGNLGL